MSVSGVVRGAKDYKKYVFWSTSLLACWELLDKMLGWQRAGGEGILTTIYGILVFLPWWAVQFRRLHDTDRSAWWALLFLIPFIGWLIIIVFNCQAGTPGEPLWTRSKTGTLKQICSPDV